MERKVIINVGEKAVLGCRDGKANERTNERIMLDGCSEINVKMFYCDLHL